MTTSTAAFSIENPELSQNKNRSSAYVSIQQLGATPLHPYSGGNVVAKIAERQKGNYMAKRAAAKTQQWRKCICGTFSRTVFGSTIGHNSPKAWEGAQESARMLSRNPPHPTSIRGPTSANSEHATRGNFLKGRASVALCVWGRSQRRGMHTQRCPAWCPQQCAATT